MSENKQTPFERWISSGNFSEISLVRNPEEFLSLLYRRRQELSLLPPYLMEIREKARRELLGISPDELAIVYGEQPTGLNEPVLVIGKRVAAEATRRRDPNIRLVEYYASGDTANSQEGFYKLVLPDPSNERGVWEHNIIPIRHFNQVAAFQISVDHLIEGFDKLGPLLIERYGSDNRRVFELIGRMAVMRYKRDKGQIQSYDQAQIALLRDIEGILGIRSRRWIRDIEFDTALAALELADGETVLSILMSQWRNFLEIARKHQIPEDTRTRIPNPNEMPFWVYLTYDGRPIRAQVFFDDDRMKFIATHPQQRDLILEEFDMDSLIERIKKGTLFLTFRVLPRAFLLSLIFDGHITGGGARYNEILQKVFPELTNCSHYPIAFMDLVDEEGRPRGVIQYRSSALNKKKNPYLVAAEKQVSRGMVSMVDLFLSLPDNARDRIEEAINSPSFNMSTRIYL